MRLFSAIDAVALGSLRKYTTAASSDLTICDVPTGLSSPLPADIRQTRHACDCLATGSILIILGNLGLLPTQLGGDKRNFYDIYRSVGSEPPMTLDLLSVEGSGSHLHCCGRDRLKAAMRGQIDNVEGLVLSDFMSKDIFFVLEEH